MTTLGLEGTGTLDLVNLAAVLGVIWKVILLPYLQVRYGVMSDMYECTRANKRRNYGRKRNQKEN